ncbi:MAG: cell envelope integrity protein TolA [Gammaproteobacteria bacterium]|nr:cell envelope integrity protein TolA [Gammaproteobacteria bacterium]MDD9850518.1 cell envelope integrity protein TolA [Gammaproteobacteria bacterium]MDD9870261.1 cell envelope integrity protein TolA [Gammaproteobacteria bacterium]
MARNRLLLGAKALLYAVAVHAALAVVLGLTLHIGGAPVAKPSPSPAGTVVQAAVVDEEAMNRALAQIAAEEEQRRLAAAERERIRLEAEQRAIAEARAAAEAEAAAAEARKKAAEEERRKAAAEAEAAAKAKAAAEAKAAARAQAAAEEERKKREAEEQEIRAEALAAVGERMAFIKRKVGENWIRPRDAKSGLRAEFVVKIAAGGRVEVVTLRKSSGDGIFDRNAQAAIFKASPLPIPDDPRYQRHYREGFVFIFDPERL